MSSHKDQPIVVEEEHNFRFYARPANYAKIIGNMKLIYGIWGFIAYIGQFFLIITAINLYSDGDRYLSCKPEWRRGDERNSEVYDTALVLLASYHLVEWVRVILFLVTLILGTNLLHVWYITSINTLFGIAAYCYAHSARYSDDGKACAENQVARAAFLTVEVILFWTTFHIMSFPQFFLMVLKKEKIEEALNKKESDSEGSGSDKDKKKDKD